MNPIFQTSIPIMVDFFLLPVSRSPNPIFVPIQPWPSWLRKWYLDTREAGEKGKQSKSRVDAAAGP